MGLKTERYPQPYRMGQAIGLKRIAGLTGSDENLTVPILFALLTAFANALNVVTQHKAGITAPERSRAEDSSLTPSGARCGSSGGRFRGRMYPELGPERQKLMTTFSAMAQRHDVKGATIPRRAGFSTDRERRSEGSKSS